MSKKNSASWSGNIVSNSLNQNTNQDFNMNNNQSGVTSSKKLGNQKNKKTATDNQWA